MGDAFSLVVFPVSAERTLVGEGKMWMCKELSDCGEIRWDGIG